MKVRVDDKRSLGADEMHLYTDFAIAGQDAFALVACMGTL